MISYASKADLHTADLGAHIHLLCEEYNEPRKYMVGHSVVWHMTRTIVVMTPITMDFGDSIDHSMTVATYKNPGEGDLISMFTVDVNPGSPNAGKGNQLFGKEI